MANNSHNVENNKRMEISQQQISVVAATCLMLAFFIFIAGVFWGKKSIPEISPAQLTSDSFADTIYSAFCSLSGWEERKSPQGLTVREVIAGDEEVLDEDGQSDEGVESIPIAEVEDVDAQNGEGPVKEEFYYAQLAGFNTLLEAQDCAQKLTARGVQVKPVERSSKTGLGQTRAWYAVITPPTTNKNELNACVDRIKRLHSIKNITVIALNNEQKNMLFGKER